MARKRKKTTAKAETKPLDQGFQERIEVYEKQIFDLKQLLEISKSLNSTLDYNILIDSILYIIMGQMKVLKASLFAKKGLDATVFTLHRNYKGFDIDHSVEHIVPEEHPVIRLFNQHYKCYTMAEIESALGSLNSLDSIACLEPSLVVPLKAKGSVNGIIILGEQIAGEGYNDEEREYILNIAVLAAIAINNAFLFEMTTTDMMTKLKMKHYFYTILDEHLEKARSGAKPLCLMMLDIDFFKKFNDTYGHNCGDEILKRVAALVHENVRSIDLAARYGGEEFVVLLPDTDLPHATKIAERIRKSVQDDVLAYEGQELSVTISIGVAKYDGERDIAGKYLVDRADKALYLSKQEGRNRVTLSD